MNYIVINDKKSTEISGLLISSLPPITKPKMRTSSEEIDGRDGDFITKLGYSAYDKEIEIGLYGDYDVDEVLRYFDSEGTIIFSNEPDKYYKFTQTDSIDLERLLRFKKAKVKFHVQPFKYSSVDDAQVFNNSVLEIPKGTYRDEDRYATAKVSEDGTINLEVRKVNRTLEVYIPVKCHCAGGGIFTVVASAKNNRTGDGSEYVGIRVCKDAPNNPQTIGGSIMYMSDSVDVNQWQNFNGIDRDFNYLYLYIQPQHKLDIDFRVIVVPTTDYFEVFNKGNIYAKPILKIRGSGLLDLYCGIGHYQTSASKRVRMNIRLIDELIIDVNEMNAYMIENDKVVYKNRLVLGDYNNLTIQSGHSYIYWRGTDEFVGQITAEEYSRWI